MLCILLLLLSPVINNFLVFSTSLTNLTHFAGWLSCIPAVTSFANGFLNQLLHNDIIHVSTHQIKLFVDSLKPLMHYQSLGWSSLSRQSYIFCSSFSQFQYLVFEHLHSIKPPLEFLNFGLLIPSVPCFSWQFGEFDLCPYSPHLWSVPLNWKLNPVA